MSASDDLKTTAVDTAVALFGIVMQPEWRETAIANFDAIAKAAKSVMEFPLDDEAEYAPVFRP